MTGQQALLYLILFQSDGKQCLMYIIHYALTKLCFAIKIEINVI